MKNNDKPKPKRKYKPPPPTIINSREKTLELVINELKELIKNIEINGNDFRNIRSDFNIASITHDINREYREYRYSITFTEIFEK